jgi:hypothetical protein
MREVKMAKLRGASAGKARRDFECEARLPDSACPDQCHEQFPFKSEDIERPGADGLRFPIDVDLHTRAPLCLRLRYADGCLEDCTG